MIYQLEALLCEQLAERLLQAGVDIEVKAGPSIAPSASNKPLLGIALAEIASRLPTLDEEAQHPREIAHRLTSLNVAAKAEVKNYDLSSKLVDDKGAESGPGKIAEIELPAGVMLRRGDDYAIEGNIIRFYEAPQQDFIVHLLAERAKGYVEHQPCRLALDINVCSKEAAQCDSLLQQALAVVLAYFAEKSVVNVLSSEQPALQQRTRLLKPVLRVGAIQRSAEKLGNARFIHSVAHLFVYGELEIHLSLGTPEMQGYIGSIGMSFNLN